MQKQKYLLREKNTRIHPKLDSTMNGFHLLPITPRWCFL